ncbi:MAG: TIR domain-containing protein, partial [Desulfobacterales bacterium]|nr:TIR domain-containing protein [Desulfobacterales bacterium]
MNQAQDMGGLFVSHAGEDVEEARKLYQGLKRAGLDPWFREENLLAGQNVDVEIRRAIGRSRFFLVLLSENSVKRGSVNKELAQALTIIDEFPESDIFIIPVRLDDCTPTHEKLQKLAPVDMFPDWEKGLGKILDAIETGAGGKSSSTGRNRPLERERTIDGRARAEKQEYPGKTPGETEERSAMPGFGVLIFLFAALLVGLYLGKDHLSLLFERYSREFGMLVILAGVALISLIASVVMFGILRSTGVFKKTGKQNQYEFGGAMAGFLVVLTILIGAYFKGIASPVYLELSGNVRFVSDGRPVEPVPDAVVALSGLPGFKTETDKEGNFTLKLPEDPRLQKLELMVSHASKTYYRVVQRGDVENIVVELPEGEEGENSGSTATGSSSVHGTRVQSPDLNAGGDITGDINITYGREEGEG